MPPADVDQPVVGTDSGYAAQNKVNSISISVNAFNALIGEMIGGSRPKANGCLSLL
jgi:hypothetical protein